MEPMDQASLQVSGIGGVAFVLARVYLHWLVR